ncbi:MAG: apolipoprotein N-acyltransferase [Actinomycetota bacterium]|jgi:apolipoprotein N-acyltransferase|nr:apolipoprotein N-acyltransferase [Actinomycetota bacterium]
MAARHAARGPARPASRPIPALRPLVSIISGLLVWTSFPPLNWWPAALAGVAGLALTTRAGSRRAAVLNGWLFGLGLFVPMLSFLRGLGLDAWLVLAVAEAVWFALLGLANRVVAGVPAWPLAVAALWTAQEWVRDRVPFGGFPWGRLAFGQAHGPLLPLAALGGAVLVTFVTALLGGLLAWVLLARGSGRVRARPLVAALVAAAAVGGAAAVTLPTAGTSTGGPSHVVVAVIQGNVPRLGLEEFAQRRAVTANHVAETQALAADVAAGRVPRPDLVVWPENASDEDPFHDAVARTMIEGAVQAVGVPIVVGAVLDGPGPRHVRNAAIVWSPTTGPGQIYVKRHLVPFGEYLPFRSVLSKLVGRFSLIGRDFAPGHSPGVLAVGAVTLADVICFEVADDGVVRQAVTGGGRLLVVQTNNATYEHAGDDGQGGETAQQLEMSRLRAVEHGRAVLVAATSGVSAVIAPDGQVVSRAGVFRPARLVADVALRDPETVADRLGDWPERALALAGLLALMLGVGRRSARPDRSTEPAADASDAPAEVVTAS